MRKQNQQDQENQEQENPSPNLLYPLETKNILIKHSPAIIKATNYVVIITSGVLLLLLFYNFILDRQLLELKEERDEIVAQIDSNADVQENAKRISKLINYYKEKKLEASPASEVLEHILASSSKHAFLRGLTYSRDKKICTLDTVAYSATAYSRMIVDLLSNDDVDSIAIREVELLSSRREYYAILEVVLK